MKKAFFIVLLLCSVHVWYITLIPHLINAENLLPWLVFIICFFSTLNESGLQFRNAVILLFVGIGANFYSAYVNQGQKPFETLFGFAGFFTILIYFYLHQVKFSIEYLEKIIVIFAVLYSLVYIIQFAVYPFRFVHAAMDVNRGTLRMRIEGNGFLVLAYLLMLNRYLLKHRIKDLVFAMALFIVLFMGGFRTLALGALICSALMFFKLVNYSPVNYLVVVLVILLFIGLFQIEFTSNILNEMISASLEQRKQGSRYIRFQTLNYFFTIYPKNISYYIIGGGMPGGDSSYYNAMRYVQIYSGFFFVDLGLIGFYIVVGLIALLGLLWFTIKAIFIKLPLDKLYLNYYFVYLLIVSFTTMELYRPGVVLVEGFAFYLIDKTAIKENALEK